MIQHLMLGPSVLSWETWRAEGKIQKTLQEDPPYRVRGPLVSVVTPTYNEENYLPNLITALCNQTYSDIELIVVDNESEDKTVRVAKESGATVVINREYNLSKSRNMGAKAAKGDMIVFIDADTFPEAIGIEKVVDEFDKGAVMAQLNSCCHDSHIQSWMRVSRGWLLGYLGSGGQFVAVTRAGYEGAGGWDEACLPQEGAHEDVEFIHRMLKSYPGRASFLRTVYSATSSRRQQVEGYIVPRHWQARAIRGGVHA